MIHHSFFLSFFQKLTKEKREKLNIVPDKKCVKLETVQYWFQIAFFFWASTVTWTLF
jgi:hypothetical protein